MKKRIFGIDWKTLIISFFAFTLFLSLVQNLQRIKRINNEIRESEASLAKIQKESDDLQTRLSQSEDQVYIEKQIRDKLGLSQEGEIVLILPPDEILRSLAMERVENEVILPDPNWKKWAKLFGFFPS